MRYRQNKGETLDDFVNRCKVKGTECDFTKEELTERIIELVVRSTPIAHFQKDLEKEKVTQLKTSSKTEGNMRRLHLEDDVSGKWTIAPLEDIMKDIMTDIMTEIETEIETNLVTGVL